MEQSLTVVPKNRASRVSLLAGVLSVMFFVTHAILNKTINTYPDRDYYLTYITLVLFSGMSAVIAISAGIISRNKMIKLHQAGTHLSSIGIILGVFGLYPALWSLCGLARYGPLLFYRSP